jgi:HEAT repeat protein
MPTISSILKQTDFKPDDAKKADGLVYDYILFGEDGIDCNDAELSHNQCKAVKSALADGVIVPYEKDVLSEEDLSKKFIDTLSGPIGTRGLWGRVKWFHLQAWKNDGIVPPLIDALDDEETAIREEAAIILGNMGPKAKGAVDELIDMLDDEYSFVRQAAIAALGKIGPDAIEAKDALIDRFKDDESAMVSHEAALALCEIAPNDSDVVSAFAYALKSIKACRRRTAALSLGKIGPGAKDAVPDLTDALKDENSSVRKEAAYALGAIGAGAIDAVPDLLHLMKNDDYEKVRKAAFWALNKISSDELETITIGPGFTVM